MLYLARFEDTKNQIDAVKAFSEALKYCPNASMVLAGSGSDGYRCRCIELAQRLGVDHRIFFMDHVDGAAKKDLLSRASVVISTSKFEGFPLSLLEAKLSGIPIVAMLLSNADALSGGEDNGTIIVNAGDIKEMGSAIASVLGNREFATQLGTAGRAHAESLMSFDQHEFWVSVLSGYDPRECPDCADGKDDLQHRLYWQFFDLLYWHTKNEEKLRAGKRKLVEENSSLLRKLDEATRAEEALKQSNSWRIGRFVTSIPRAIKRRYKG